MFLSLFFFSLFLFSPAAVADLAAETAALTAFRNAVGLVALPWNTSISPCKWKGVSCSGNRVTSLRLPGRGLIGQIPAGTLGNLSSLRTLSLHHNALFGPVPSDLSRCTQLQFLYLNRNGFSGEILPLMSSITSLIRLNLAGNNFSGLIPSSLINLTRLNMLYLENNNFSGEMPADMNFPKLKWFNVSLNRLNGSVPEKLRGFPASSFSGNSLCGEPLASCHKETPAVSPAPVPSVSPVPPVGPATPVPPVPQESSSLSGGAIAGIVIGAVALALLILAVLFLFFLRKSKRVVASLPEQPAPKLPEFEIKIKKVAAATAPPPGIAVSRKQLVFLGNAPRVFDLEDLLRASAEVLGKGSYGIAYRVAVGENLSVAVKRLKNVRMPEKEFAEKMKAISAMEHHNLVTLRAYYYGRDEKLLVYDYMPLGSLSSLLHGNRGSGRPPLKWETRVKIALEAARAIEFIHSTSPSACHGNIKSSNVLITSSYGARVSDHGVAHLVPSSPPHTLTPESDVFSFGVLLLELVTGKAPAEGGGVINLPRWVVSLIREERVGELFDEELVRFGSPEEEMVMLLQVGVDCSSENPEHRPEMSSVVAKIEEVLHWADRKKDKLKEKEGPIF